MRDTDKGEEAWMDHLSKYGLLNLHHEALEVGYRLRVATGTTFDLEYQGGLAKYSQPPFWLQTFTDDPVGRNAARNFLADVRAYIQVVKENSREQR